MVQEWQPGPTNIPTSPAVAPGTLSVSMRNCCSSGAWQFHVGLCSRKN